MPKTPKMTMANRTKVLDDLSKTLDHVLTELYGVRLGFALFMFPFSGEGEAGDYISNSQRKHMIKFMREIADRLEKNQIIGTPEGEA